MQFLKYRLPAVLWMVLIFFLSSIPGDDLPDIEIPFIHLIAHIVEYSILGFLLMRSFLSSVGWEQRYFAAVTAFVISVLFAASDEWHQTFVAGRSGDAMTVVYDAAFAVCGIGTYLLFLKRNK